MGKAECSHRVSKVCAIHATYDFPTRASRARPPVLVLPSDQAERFGALPLEWLHHSIIRILVFTTLLAGVFLSTVGCKRAASDNLAATVNGRPITYGDLDKQYQAQFVSSAERPSDDQMMIQKLEVLRTLVDNEIMLQRAEKLGLMATDADVESRFAELKHHIPRRNFRNSWLTRKMSAEDMKAQLKRDLSITKLFNEDHVSHLHFR